MGADLSRVRLNPLLDYAGVELKQGGVFLDADANELTAILDRRLRALASDTLGRARVSSTTKDAFKITVAAGSLQIGKGRLYVDGLLAENHGAPSTTAAKRLFDDLMAEPAFADPIAYATQPYLNPAPALPTAGRHLVYLDVWNREVTHLEQPNLVESAVGVETSSRIQTVWQVRVLAEAAGNATCATPDADVPGWGNQIAPSTGILTTGTFEVAPVDDPCELPPTGGYRGLENQTYRVEIHNPGQPGTNATFKWSRENASVGSRVASMISGTELELQTLGRDDVLRFNTGDWVEIVDDAREFSQAAGEMRRVTVIDATRRIQFTPALPSTMLPASFPDSTHPKTRNLRVRRWDQKGKIFRTDASGNPVQVQDLDALGSTGLISVPASTTTLILENGVTVNFASTGTKGFKAGDYWVFAARTSDASVEILDRAPPRGIHHHYARLGIWDVGAASVVDCRNPWPPPQGEGHDCSCTACVTAESHASGQFTIQQAVDQVRETGGTVCLGPGQYALSEPVRLIGARSVRIRGQGPATFIVSAGGAFLLQTCIAVAIENLAIVTLARQSAITVRTALGLALRELVIGVIGSNDFRASAISLGGVVAGADMSHNAILAPIGIMANDTAAIPPGNEENTPDFLLTAALAIENNILFCQRAAVVLVGGSLHLMGTRVCGNEILGCSEGAISTLGVGAPGSSMKICDNSINVTGSGIACGVDGAWIDGNKLNNTAAEANRVASTVGIALAAGLDRNGSDQCQVLANQISRFSMAGILVSAPVRDLIIKLNIIEDCGNGILSLDDSKSGSISIENNHLRNIGSVAGRAANVIGIGTSRADSVTIGGNTIRSVGAQAAQSPLRAAIMTSGVLQARITGNEVSEIGPAGDFVGFSIGILVRAPYLQFELSRNQVQRDVLPVNTASNGAWLAVGISDADVQNGLSRAGGFATVQVDVNRALVVGNGRAFLSTIGVAGAATDVQDLPRGAMLGNVFSARGIAPAVEAVVPGECLFNDNRVELRGPRTRPAVQLSTLIAIVNANRVRGGEASILLQGTKAATVLGNITSAPIVPNGQQAPWKDLNLIA